MEWDPNERDAWVSDAQRWISSIKGVLQCKIDLDSEGEISGVHVVAGMEREPRHIVRDVESLLKARLEIDVFYKKIGVVQVLDNEISDLSREATATEQMVESSDSQPRFRASSIAHMNNHATEEAKKNSAVTFHPMEETALVDDTLLEDSPKISPANNHSHDEPLEDPIPEPTPVAKETSSASDEPAPIPAVLLTEEGAQRIVCSGVGVMASDMLVRAEVQLRTGELEVRGTQEGANHAGSAIQLVARATLNALMQLVSDPILLHLNEVRTDQLGDEPIVLCAIDLVEGRKSEILFGSCSNLHNEQQAVVFAVMDALNRRLSMYSLKTAAAEG